MMLLKQCLLLAVVVAVFTVADAGTWFSSRLLRNPGLFKTTAANMQACIKYCSVLTTNCSAVSYQQDTGLCYYSVCNNLDLVQNDGWNTYIDDTFYVEGKDFPAPQFEWMLTSFCGSSNQGIQSGPNMDTTYAVITKLTTAVGSYVTGTSKFAVTGTTYYATTSEPDTSLYNAMGTTSSYSVMFWMYPTSVSSTKMLLQYTVGFSTYQGPYIYYSPYYIYFSLTSGSNYYSAGYSVSLNTWSHVAFVYDAKYSLLKLFINGVIVQAYTGTVYNSYSYSRWDTITLGYSPFGTYAAYYGNMYCVRIYNSAMNTKQVSAAMTSCNKVKARFS